MPNEDSFDWFIDNNEFETNEFGYITLKLNELQHEDREANNHELNEHDKTEHENNTKNKAPKRSLLKNIIKTRDDHQPIDFEESETVGKFQTYKGTEASWITQDQEFGYQELRARIEPWLTALFQSEHLSLLAGSGLTYAISHIAKGKPEYKEKSSNENASTEKEDDVKKMWIMPFPKSKIESILAEILKDSANKAGREEPNFEDQLRVANELLRGYEILQNTEQAEKLSSDLKNALSDFSHSILTGEEEIITGQLNHREDAFNVLVTFLMSFASRTGTRDRLNIFTTNYDRLIEAGGEIAGLHLLDRFLGNLMPIFRSSRLDLDMHYNPPGIRGEPRYLEGVARFTKLHGSLDWVQTDKDIRRIGLPFGASSIKPYLDAPGLNNATPYNLMIYPNASKDRETADYPYVELFRDFAAASCRPNSTLVTYGYSFGDDHINRVIRDMLTIPSTHLVIISRDDSLGRIMKTYEELGRPAQISLLIGPALADIEILTNHFLPKAAIDKTTFRMSELLKQRFGTKSQQPQQPQDVNFDE